uniref:Copia protein n=1 Tax=Tanacetum cinerariifolium TaxID=118510 RepID=A0A6L2K1X0_TANCI|nr:copia protein [Tanacetum cinerariifolium]
MIIRKDSKIVKAKVERKSLALKAKKESSDEKCSTSGSEYKEYTIAVRDLKKFFKKRGRFMRQPRNDKQTFQRTRDDKNDNVEHVDNLRFNLLSIGQICDNKCRVTFSEHDSEITKSGKVIVRNLPKLKFDQHFCDACKIREQAHASHKAKNIVSTTRCLELLHMDLFGPSAIRSYRGNYYIIVIVDDYSRKIKESLNVTFNETPLPSKTSPLVDDDLDEEEAIRATKKKNLENVVKDETLEIDKIVIIKESKNHPLEKVIRNLNQRTLRNKLDENGVVSQNKARLVAQGYNQQKGIDYVKTYALIARLESIRILLAYTYALDFKLFQMDVKSAFLNGFIYEEV